MGSVRTRVAVLLGGLLLAASGGNVAGAQEPPSVTTDALDGSISTFTGCDGETTTTVNVGFAAIRRPEGSSGALSVDVAYGGTLTAGVDYDPLPDPVVLADGESSALLSIEPARTGNVTVTVEPGAGYVVGDPATSTVEFPPIRSTTSCVATGEEEQTIELGTAPEPIDVFGRYGSFLGDTILSIEGNVPPGLTYVVDGTWGGKATEVGTFEFVARYCLDPGGDEVCALELPIRIIVVPVDDGTSSPPASPIPDAARFTG